MTKWSTTGCTVECGEHCRSEGVISERKACAKGQWFQYLEHSQCECQKKTDLNHHHKELRQHMRSHDFHRRNTWNCTHKTFCSRYFFAQKRETLRKKNLSLKACCFCLFVFFFFGEKVLNPSGLPQSVQQSFLRKNQPLTSYKAAIQQPLFSVQHKSQRCQTRRHEKCDTETTTNKVVIALWVEEKIWLNLRTWVKLGCEGRTTISTPPLPRQYQFAISRTVICSWPSVNFPL